MDTLMVHRCKECLRFQRAMSTNTTSPIGGSDHATRTADSTREKVKSTASVTVVTQLSPTVKGLVLKVHDKRLSFKAGQWVDMFIPGVDVMTGFSMTSSPRKLQQEGLLDLAVKISDHPPAAWVHAKCEVGSEVSIRVGGDFYFDPQPEESPRPVLLLAGGVGINPLCSILHHVADLYQTSDNGPEKVRVLYSAKNEDELIFKDSLVTLQEKHSCVRCQFYVTKDPAKSTQAINRRINEEDVRESVNELGSGNVLCFICGPSPMIEDLESMLLTLKVPKEHIFYEKWW